MSDAALSAYLVNRLSGLASLAGFGTGVGCTGAWLGGGSDLADPALWTGAALLGATLAGRHALMQLWPSRVAQSLPAGRPDQIDGAGGSRLHVEAYGPAAEPDDPLGIDDALGIKAGANSGATLILTHAPGVDSGALAALAAPLARDRRVILWDLAGTGQSTRPLDGLYSVRRFAHDLRMVIETAPGPVVLVAHSASAAIALRCAQTYGQALGDRLAGLVLLDPLWADEKGLPAVVNRLLGFDAVAPGLAWLSDLASYLSGAAHLIARTRFFGASPSRESVDLAARLFCCSSPSVNAKHIRALAEARPSPRAEGPPMLVVVGDDDRSAPHRTLTGADVLSHVDGAGLAGPMDLPDAYAAAIDDWLTGQRIGGETEGTPHAERLRHRPEWEQAMAGPASPAATAGDLGYSPA